VIRELSIDDLVLADNVQLTLGEGLIAVTGETGAGKSLVAAAIDLIAGQRGRTELIRHGAKVARVSARIEVPNEARAALDSALAAMGLPGVEDECLILRRHLGRGGTSQAWIGDRPVTVGALRLLMAPRIRRIDQGAAQTLCEAEGRRKLLDRAIKKPHLLKTMADAWDRQGRAQAAYDAWCDKATKAADELDLVDHWVAELDRFAPAQGEFDHLLDQRERGRRAEALRDVVLLGERLLGFEEGAIGKIQALTGRASDHIEALEGPLFDHLDAAEEACNTALRTLQKSLGESASPEALSVCEDRLFRTRELARKHRCEPSELAQIAQRLRDEQAALRAPQEQIDKAHRALTAALAETAAAAKALGRARRRAAAALITEVRAMLPELGLADARLRFELSEVAIGPSGSEAVDLLLAANPGEPEAAIGSGASGGERARIFLALDCALPRPTGTLLTVYDEVDSGIGGRAAVAVGGMLRRRGEAGQHW
jgi:DNA repair protein RecN (Recombination protein N)